MTDEQPVVSEGAPALDDTDGTAHEIDVDLADFEGRPQTGILGFTVREVLIVGVWLVAFIASFFPLFGSGSNSVWGADLSWLLPVGLPTVAVFLLVLRRLSPEGIRRVGSLGIDQFASVGFSVAAVSWGVLLWQSVRISLQADHGLAGSWVVWVSFVAMLALVVFTVGAPLVPALREDFEHRFETLAHPVANPIRPVLRDTAPRHTAAPEPENSAAEVEDGATPDELDAEEER